MIIHYTKIYIEWLVFAVQYSSCYPENPGLGIGGGGQSRVVG